MTRRLDTPRLWRHFDHRNAALDRYLRNVIRKATTPLLAEAHALLGC